MSLFPVSTDLALFQSTDQLIGVADDLNRLDITSFGLLTRTARNITEVTKKIRQDNERGWSDICPNHPFDELTPPGLDVVVTDGGNETLRTLDDYIRNWRWDEFTFTKSRVSIVDIFQRFTNDVQRLEEELRTATTAYTDATNRVINFRRRDEGNLLVRNLDKIGSGMREVKTLRDFQAGVLSNGPIYVNTRNITTILVVVKKGQAEDFVKNYDEGHEYVVPDSIQQLQADNDFVCFSVSLLTPNLDDYKSATKEKQWHVRDFVYNQKMSEQLAEEAQRTVAGYIAESRKYIELLEATFSHLSVLWVHIKAVRIFVEATLLYGIPPKFKTWLVSASPKNIAKIHKGLGAIFDDGMADGVGDDAVAAAGEDAEYHPYVSFQLNLVGLIPVSSKK